MPFFNDIYGSEIGDFIDFALVFIRGKEFFDDIESYDVIVNDSGFFYFSFIFSLNLLL